ncbi:MAG: AMP-dependent synthetase/ligase [Gemmatimonadaceae bacterium]|nr:AMP-dependent synthetase/ligase [Gemmatimonadaceae bacterium]
MTDRTVVEVFLAQAAASGDRVALRTRTGDVITWRDWARRSAAVAHALVRDGVMPGDRVAIFAGNRPLWPIADLGILMAGAVSVGVYPTSATSQVRTLLGDAGVVVALVDTPARLEQVRAAWRDLPTLRLVVAEHAPADGWRAAEAALASWATDAGETPPTGGWPLRQPDDDAVLIYTSGSTGTPKGARLSHRALLANAASVAETLSLTPDDTTLSFLPYCHAAERIFGLCTRVLVGMEALLVEEIADVFPAAREYQPTIFGGLPRLYEKAHAAAMAVAPAARPDVLAGFVGRRVRRATSGGAALPPGVVADLDAAGLAVLGAYGLTEHLCVAMQRPGRAAGDDRAGPPMPGTTLRIADDGEILVARGPHTFGGYWGQADETAEAFTPDGAWLRTGDLGTLDADGVLRVTGRRKELLALSGGKKVAPAPIEAALAASPFVAQALCFGEGRPYVVALLAPAAPAVAERASAWGVAPEAVPHDPRWQAAIAAVIDGVNAGLSRPEQVRRWAMLPRELAVEHDELTPTLKPRRDVVAARWQREIDGLYAAGVA